MQKNEGATRRRKGQGSIFQRPNGTYTGRITMGGGNTYSYTGTSKKEVEKKLEEFRISTLKEEVVPQRITVNAYIEQWLQHVKMPSLKASAFDRLERTYENYIRKSPVGRSQMGNLTSLDIQKLITEKSLDYSYSTVKKIYGLLNECMGYAVANRDLNFNPVLAVKMPKRENMRKKTKTIQVFTEEELHKIEKVAEITYQSGEVRYKHTMLFVLMANTGLRAGEAIALTWSNVDLDNRVISISQNASCVKDRNENSDKKYEVIITSVKTQNGNRLIPCNDKAMEALLWLKKYQEDHKIQSEFVDCNEKGEILKQQTLPKILAKILKAANVPYRNVHSFRHTFATNLISKGVDVKVVSQLLGHASVKITYDTYVHVKIDSAIHAVNLLNSERGE